MRRSFQGRSLLLPTVANLLRSSNAQAVRDVSPLRVDVSRWVSIVEEFREACGEGLGNLLRLQLTDV